MGCPAVFEACCPWDGVAKVARSRIREIATAFFMMVFLLQSKAYHKLRNFQEKITGVSFPGIDAI
jgi:hypothetical protein